jgi:hypothetical protein
MNPLDGFISSVSMPPPRQFPWGKADARPVMPRGLAEFSRTDVCHNVCHAYKKKRGWKTSGPRRVHITAGNQTGALAYCLNIARPFGSARRVRGRFVLGNSRVLSIRYIFFYPQRVQSLRRRTKPKRGAYSSRCRAREGCGPLVFEKGTKNFRCLVHGV